MNIFILDEDPALAAQYHCDKHVVKMVLETAQLLSTAHRVLNGHKTQIVSKNGRKQTDYKLQDKILDKKIYKATHINHPSSIWVRESKPNYKWAYILFVELCNEYRLRYSKEHLCFTKLNHWLQILPDNIPDKSLTPFKLAMPEEYKTSCPVTSYRTYYKKDKAYMAKWEKLDNIPQWW